MREMAVLNDTELEKLQGLSETEAAERLGRDGYNELEADRKTSVFRIVLSVLHEPMFILLVACGTLYLVLGDLREASMLLFFVFVIMGITIYQENKTEKALSALRDLSSPRALVIRNGQRRRIGGREVVADDLVILSEGDRVPADGRLLWSRNLSIDESLLTGESVPVSKSPAEGVSGEMPRPGGDDTPFVFSGTLVVQGQGICRIVCTGVRTEMGKIGHALSSIREEPTSLQKETGGVVKKVFAGAIVLCGAVIVGYGLARGQWVNGLLAGITLAMALLPEEFPVVLTIFLALGAWKLSRKKVLARRIATVETLGAATVLCVDKTGTLTENKMTLRRLYDAKSGLFLDVKKTSPGSLPEEFHTLVEYGILASKKDPFDPMEKALRELGVKTLEHTEHLHDRWDLVEEYPLSRELQALSHVWKGDEGQYTVASKGAPESVFDLCHLEETRKQELSKAVETLASEELRVLGVARAKFKRESLPGNQHDFHFEFLGLLGLADPVRETVPQAVKECHEAGIRIIMITGDYPSTARTIGRTIGLSGPEHVMTGAQLASMDEPALCEAVKTTNIFARVVPEQKLKIVNALKANGEITAMTGDGVNDAPALKAAHIGVAMGERGTDVAREAAGLVLVSDDFSNIVEAVRTGRKIYDNIRKAMAYIVSVHIPIAGLSLMPVFLGYPAILFPVHIVFLELIIDPTCTIVFEAEQEEPDIMRRRPRDPDKQLFSGKMLMLSFFQGLSSLLIVAAVYLIAVRHFGKSAEGFAEARTLAFVTLIVSNLCLILTNRSWTESIFTSMRQENKALPYVAVGAALLLLAVLYAPYLMSMFHFTYMHPSDFLLSIAAGVATIAWFELVKLSMRKRGGHLAQI
ncbi:MAG: cation-translocating P-type ATPase [Planctomycetaceae bacterium]|nr:cation-translocating P-type ATPase [Planctomycetaceae bacterium]